MNLPKFSEYDHHKKVYSWTTKNLPQEANSAHEQDAQLQFIYFAGYSDDFDGLRMTLHNMQNYSWAANVMMMGGDGLSNLGGYQNGYTHFLMTAFTFPDTWHVLGQSDPPFFSSYSADFGGNFPPPSLTPGPTPYGYIRPTSGSVLSYDAAEMLSNAAVALSKQTQNKLLTMQQTFNKYCSLPIQTIPIRKSVDRSESDFQVTRLIKQFLCSRLILADVHIW